MQTKIVSLHKLAPIIFMKYHPSLQRTLRNEQIFQITYLVRCLQFVHKLKKERRDVITSSIPYFLFKFPVGVNEKICVQRNLKGGENPEEENLVPLQKG
jgi:hypothetical protein